jgi:enamine deaminase RidA (YjgF/YER057c/UK114 family)
VTPDERLAVCRLPAGSRVPSWALELHHAFLALVRTDDELTVVCPEATVPPDVEADGGWRLSPDGRGELVFGAHALVREVAASRPEGGRRQRVASGSPFEPRIGFSRAIRAGGRVLVSGTGPVMPDGTCPPDTRAQARRCWQIVLAALAEAGATAADVVRTRTLLTPAGDAEEAMAAHGEVFAAVRPASTMLVVHALLDPRWTVEVEAEAEL